ncbi:mutS domain V [Colletotrichum higginsianum]|nr:mutS domain V [Colletotrichum higginsianum]
MESKLTDSLRDKFRDLDNNDVYTSVKAQAASDQARNFVVEFNHDEAKIASGLSSDEFGVLLGQKSPDGMVRWINIWSPSKQTSVVKQIGNRYGFSPRLQALMVAPNLASVLEVDNKQDSKQGDIESVLMHDEPKAQPSTHTTEQSLEDIEIYQLVKETVNYTSIDQGKESVVISFHETPPTEQPGREDWARDELQSMRSNTLSVLCQLSKHGIADFTDRLVSFKRVRQALSVTEPRAKVACEGSSNLFYYLFEDYSAAMPVLKTSKLQLEHLHGYFEPSENVSGEVNISPSARSRFERLGDRLQLLMLNTIQERLEEQKALSDTYFSLTAQKDSQATARLSRSATLLAKLSVFFLPITFMTSYFSVEIPDLVEHYTPKMYWICFAIIAGLSFVSLFFFGRMLETVSDTLEGWADSVSGRARGLTGSNVHHDRDEQ